MGHAFINKISYYTWIMKTNGIIIANIHNHSVEKVRFGTDQLRYMPTVNVYF